MALVTHKRIESMRQSHLGQVKGNLEVRCIIITYHLTFSYHFFLSLSRTLTERNLQTQEDKRKLLAEKLAEKREKELREEEPK